jgi:hypothetical protein
MFFSFMQLHVYRACRQVLRDIYILLPNVLVITLALSLMFWLVCHCGPSGGLQQHCGQQESAYEPLRMEQGQMSSSCSPEVQLHSPSSGSDEATALPVWLKPRAKGSQLEEM